MDKIVPALCREIGEAKKDFRYYTPGVWDTHVPLAKKWCRVVVTSYRKRVSPRLRLAATEFLALYGSPQNGARADEPMVKRFSVRWTAAQMDVIKQAASKAGQDVTEFVRLAALDRARSMIGEA